MITNFITILHLILKTNDCNSKQLYFITESNVSGVKSFRPQRKVFFFSENGIINVTGTTVCNKRQQFGASNSD